MVEQALQKGSPSWIRFEDVLTNEAGKYQYWTVVAEIEDFSKREDNIFIEHRATLSYLIRDKIEILSESFRSDEWEIQFDIGNVEIEKLDDGIVCYENLGDDCGRVFISLNDSIGGHPKKWRLWPTFEKYFNLREDKYGNLIDPYSGELIVEIPCPAEGGAVRIRTDYLQDYLAARKMILIRQHDYRRFWQEHNPDVPENEGSGLQIHNEKWGCYTLYISNSKTSSIELFSRLVFKDMVTPYEKAGTIGGIRKSQIDDYPEFIICKDLNGKEILRKPTPNDLSPVYFNPKVLKRYYDEPTRFTVTFYAPGMGSVSFLNKWIIPIGRNDENLIIVWLGDLVKSGLSYEEINHWRTYNVFPRGGMAHDFWNAQIQCNPSKIPSLESRLVDCKNVLIKCLELKGKTIYKKYEGPDINIEKRLRIPLCNEHPEFQETILLLANMFIDSIDTKSIKDDLDDEYTKDKNGNNLGPIVLFSNWLHVIMNVPLNLTEGTKKSLQYIQMVRSKAGAAHRFSDSGYKEIIQKLNLKGERITACLLYSSVAEPLADNLEKLCEFFHVDNELWWLEYHED